MSGPVELLAEEMHEAIDVGERGAQLVTDVVNEVIAQFFGGEQRRVAFGERPLHVHVGGDVDEGEEACSFRKRLDRQIENDAVIAFDATREACSRLAQARHDATQVAPRRVVLGEQAAALFGDGFETRLF